MSRLSFILFLLLASTSAHAQGGLRWLADSVVLHQIGCKYTPDSLTASFVNNSSKPILLDTINGPTSSWVIDQPTSFANLLVAPGSVHTVKLYLKIPNRYRNERLVLNAADGTKDTLKLREDIQTSYLTFNAEDTMRFTNTRALGTLSMMYYNSYTATGSVPFIVRSVIVTGDTTFNVTHTGGDTVRPGVPGFYAIATAHTPVEYGSDTSVVTLRGGPCDSLYRFVVIVDTKEPAPPGVGWDYGYLSMSSDCGKTTTTTNHLLNESQLVKSVDSVRIVGDSKFSLISTIPPNRLNNFTIAPGDSITYSIAFGAFQTDLEPHSAFLIAYSTDGSATRHVWRGPSARAV